SRRGIIETRNIQSSRISHKITSRLQTIEPELPTIICTNRRSLVQRARSIQCHFHLPDASSALVDNTTGDEAGGLRLWRLHSDDDVSKMLAGRDRKGEILIIIVPVEKLNRRPSVVTEDVVSHEVPCGVRF